MTKKTDVSIIIPIYNAASNIGSLLSTLLKEKRVNLEIIIVNDGSTDNTESVVLSFKDDRVIYFKQENRGVYAARNLALSHHSGEWVMFLDADDTVIDDFIFERLRFAQESAVDVVIYNAYRCSSLADTRRSVHSNQLYNNKINGHTWLNDCVQKSEWPHYLWLQMIRSRYITENNIVFHEGRSHKDILWTTELAENNGDFIVSDIHGYTYIYNGSSITHRSDYYDFRAHDYIDIISTLIKKAFDIQNHDIKKSLLKHAFFESRHYLGLYRKKVCNKRGVKLNFKREISLLTLMKGVSNLSDLFFFIKLCIKMR